MRERIKALCEGWTWVDWFGAGVCSAMTLYLIGQVVRVGGF